METLVGILWMHSGFTNAPTMIVRDRSSFHCAIYENVSEIMEITSNISCITIQIWGTNKKMFDFLLPFKLS